MRGKLKRVNIVLSKEQHNRFKEYAKRYHGSLSQFLRLAGENEIDDQEDDNDFHLRPLIERQKKIQQLLEKMTHHIKKLQKIQGVSEDFNLTDKQSIAYDIEHVLLAGETPLSIPEIMEYVSCSQEEIIGGIEWLLDRFIISRIKRINAPSKYKLRGDINE
jgi:predicted DNA-binding protein